jgi:hypothetical protein
MGKHLNKLVRNPVAWVAAGGAFLLFGVFFPLAAIHIVSLDNEGKGTATGRDGRRTTETGSVFYHESGTFSIEEKHPQPVQKAVAEHKEVWCLSGYHSTDVYIVFEGRTVEAIVETFQEATDGLKSWLMYRGGEEVTGGTATLVISKRWNGEVADKGFRLSCIFKTTVPPKAPGEFQVATVDNSRIRVLPGYWNEAKASMVESSGRISSASDARRIHADRHAHINDDGKTWSSFKEENSSSSGAAYRVN